MSKLFRRASVSAIACLILPAMPVQAQTPPAQLSVGTKFVKDNCLDVKPDGTLVINRCNAQPPQAIDYDDTTGQLKTAGQCIAAKERGQPLALVACEEKPEQQWTFEANGALKTDSGLCADVLNFWKDPGTSVIAWDCTAAENQAFFLTNIRLAPGAKPAAPATAARNDITGTPSIASYFVPGLCLEASGSRGQVAIEVCDRGDGQDFRFKAGNSGAIVQRDKCLTSTGQGNGLELAACTGAAEQDWTFTTEGTLRTRSNLCADILNFGTQPGASVIAWECTATDNQKWYPAVAAKSGSFTLGETVADNLRAGGTTTVTLLAGFSGGNITGAGGKTLSADADGRITGGEKDTIVAGGAGVVMLRFPKGLAAPAVTEAGKAGGTSILPSDWSFFSGPNAGKFPL